MANAPADKRRVGRRLMKFGGGYMSRSTYRQRRGPRVQEGQEELLLDSYHTTPPEQRTLAPGLPTFESNYKQERDQPTNHPFCRGGGGGGLPKRLSFSVHQTPKPLPSLQQSSPDASPSVLAQPYRRGSYDQMQMAGCERGQPGGCIRRCCVEHPKPESEEDDERSATPEPSAHPTVRELKCQCEEAGIVDGSHARKAQARECTHERQGVEEAAHGDPKISPGQASCLAPKESTSSRKMSWAWLAFGRRVSWQRRSPNSTGDGRVSLATRQPLASLRRCNASTAGPEAAGRAIRQTRKAPPARHAGGPRHPFENLFLRAADRGGCRSRVADRGLSIESVSSCQTAARALMCRLAGAPHAAAERAAAPLAPSTWPPTACGVPAERDPVSEHVVLTRRGELTHAHRAISTLAPRAAGPRPTGSMWRTCSCSAVVVARSLAELASASDPPSSLLPLACRRVLGRVLIAAVPGHRRRGVWGRYEGESRHRPTVVGFVARLRCVEAGIRRVAVWPHPRVSGCGLLLLWCLCPD
jgi:hypothetical protein